MHDFFEASRRHYTDAVCLENSQRFPNAAQLHGLAAECGLKSLIEKFLGFKKGDLPKDYRNHADVLAKSLSTLRVSANGRQETKYFNMLTQYNSFEKHWRIEHRYWPTRKIDAHLTRHWDRMQTASAEVQKMLDVALADGYLS